MPDATRSTFCDPITGLVACYEFEGNAKDGSGNGLDATAMSVTFAPGRVGQAMQVGNSSNVTVSANNLFDDVSAFTIEAWIQPSTLAGTSDILNVNNEYAFSLRFDGRLSCSNRASGAGQVVSNTTVPTGQWTHVACTYDGVTENVYISGSNVGTRSSAGGTTGPNSMTLAGGPSGPPLLGLIDQLRLMSIARTAAEICADADRVSCP